MGNKQECHGNQRTCSHTIWSFVFHDRFIIFPHNRKIIIIIMTKVDAMASPHDEETLPPATTTEEQPTSPAAPYTMSKVSTMPEATATQGNIVDQSTAGTILEGAFVDPAYKWPPSDGEGKNAIELQASLNLLHQSGLPEDDDNDSVQTPDSMRQRMSLFRSNNYNNTLVSTSKSSFGLFSSCCGRRSSTDAVITSSSHREALMQQKGLQQARQDYVAWKQGRYRDKVKRLRQQERYSRVPEGIFIYRLDTTTNTIHLMSTPHARTDTNTLVSEMTIVKAIPSPDKSRRGIVVTGSDGTKMTLVATEQRTATAWLEAMNLMLAKKSRHFEIFGTKVNTNLLRKLILSRVAQCVIC
jgi:hypothetical protein